MGDTLQVLVQIAPVFLTLIFGALLRRYAFKDAAPWDVLNSLVYWFLAPMLLFYSILSADLQFGNIVSYLSVLFLGLMGTFSVVVLVCNRLNFSLPICNSTVQGACRHNTFMALAISASLMGKEGLAIATLATAFQVVVTNLCVMGYITSYTQNPDGKISWGKLLLKLSFNPLLLSIFVALLIKISGVDYIPIISETTSLIGRSAMPISLLAAGAGLTLSIEREKISPLVTGVVAKMMIFPAFVLFFGWVFELSPAYFLVAFIYAAVPTAASSYVVARLTGGDAPLLSSMTLFQVILSFFSFGALVLFFDFSLVLK